MTTHTESELTNPKGEPVGWGSSDGQGNVRVKKAPIGFPVTYVTGLDDEGRYAAGSVFAATVTGEHEDGNLRLLVHFPHGSEGRTHVPHVDLDLSGNVDRNGDPIKFTGGKWAPVEVGE